MRSYYLLIILLLSTIVLAQTAIFTFTIQRASDQYSAGFEMYNEEIYELDFGGKIFTNSITADMHLKPCAGEEKFDCGTTKLCVKFDSETTPECKTLVNTETQNITFTVNRAVQKAIFTVDSVRDTGGDYEARMDTVSRQTGLITTLSRSLLSLRGTQPVNLGKVREIINATNGTLATVTSSDTRAPAWFDDGSGNSATSRTTTPIFNDNTLTCLNSDSNLDDEGNPKCDFVDEKECADKGKDWLKGDCCGDAEYLPATGCQWYADKQAACGQDSAGKWKWAALDDIGLITSYSGACPTVQLVSDGTKFYTCTLDISTIVPPNLAAKIGGIITIQGHDYLCQGENIIECGGETPYSPGALPTGSKLMITGKMNYCDAFGTFRIVLKDKVSCEKSGFTWTGAQCCGEQDDPTKTYEDPYAGQGTAGGCYNGVFIKSGGFVDGAQTIINYRGKFYQCDPTLANGTTTPINSPIFAGTNVTLTAKGSCGKPMDSALLTGTKQNILCLPTGQWYFTSSTETSAVKQTLWQPAETEQKQGCCPDSQCWDGKNCRSIGEYYILGDRGFRCQ